MTVIEISLNHVACTGCIGKIKRRIEKFEGVRKVKILTGSGKIQINYNEDIVKKDNLQLRIHQLASRTFD